MSYTTNRQPQGVPLNLCNILREAMIGELVAIEDYSTAIANTENKEVREMFQHILEEEKKHYGMFLDYLRKIDKEQMEAIEHGKNHGNVSGNKEVKNDHKGSARKSKCDILEFVRKNIKGELEAIVLYEQQEAQIKDEEAKKIFKEIIKDEKNHTETLTRALTLLDKDKYGPIEQ